MSIIIDAVLILIILGSIYRGYKRGIIDVGFSLLAIIVSILITILLYSPIKNLIINNTEIDERIAQVIIDNGKTSKEKEESNESDEDKKSGIDSYIHNYSKNIVQGTQNTIVENSAKPIAENVIGIGVMILLFILTRIALEIIKLFTDIIAKIPIIKQCNEIAGLLYGIIFGLVIVYGILAIIFFIVSLSGDTFINTAIEQSFITKFFYNNNLILKLLF